MVVEGRGKLGITGREYCSKCEHYSLSNGWCYFNHQQLSYGKRDCMYFREIDNEIKYVADYQLPKW